MVKIRRPHGEFEVKSKNFYFRAARPRVFVDVRHYESSAQVPTSARAYSVLVRFLVTEIDDLCESFIFVLAFSSLSHYWINVYLDIVGLFDFFLIQYTVEVLYSPSSAAKPGLGPGLRFLGAPLWVSSVGACLGRRFGFGRLGR